MGPVGQSTSSSVQAFLCLSALVAATSAAPQIFRGGLGGVGVTSTRVGGAPTVGAPTPPHPITNGVHGVGIGHGIVGHGIGHGAVGHGIGHGVVGHGIGHGIVGHAVAHPIAHAVAEVYPDEISPYQYQYAVADD